MQMLHTATLNALTTDPRDFDLGAMVDEATADGDRGEFDKQKIGRASCRERV